jgi:hypothetical protein
MNLELELACRLSISSISFRGLGVRGMLVLLVCLSVGVLVGPCIRVSQLQFVVLLLRTGWCSRRARGAQAQTKPIRAGEIGGPSGRARL